MLREAREQLGLSVADVAAQTKFAPRQIEALEEDDFKNLPETAFLRGFVRSYAKILHMDAEVFLAALPQAKAPAVELIPASVDVPFPKEYSAQKNLLMLGAALLIALIVVGFAVWHFTTPLKRIKGVKIETPVSLPAEVQIIPAPPVQKHNMVEQSLPEQPKSDKAKHDKAKPPVSVTENKPVVRAAKTAAASAVPQSQSADTATRNGTATKDYLAAYGVR